MDIYLYEEKYALGYSKALSLAECSFNFFINDLDNGFEGMLTQFADGALKIQNDVDRLEYWTLSNISLIRNKMLRT